MIRFRRHVAALVSVALAITAVAALTASPAEAVHEGPAVRSPGFSSETLARNDDGSTGLVDIGFPVKLFGQTYSQLYVNNNGNVTFDEALDDFPPTTLAEAERVILAPFFADVDTRNAGDPVRYGPGIVNGHAAFGVNWINVDCYQSSADHDQRNNFQLVLIDRSDIAPGDFDIEFNYDRIQWETGQASGGDADCLGGDSSRVGYSNGVDTTFELPGSGQPGSFLDSNLTSGLVHNALNSTQPGRYRFFVRGGAPSTATPAASNTTFVEQAYIDFLGRFPDPGGRDYWLQLLGSGLDRAGLLRAFAATNEYTSVLVNRLYDDILNRLPDSGGLAYWRASLQAGLPESAFVGLLVGSTEFFELAGNSVSGFVELAYTVILGRSPDPQGATYWAGVIQAGTSRTIIGAALYQSLEERLARVTVLYHELLRRDPDPDGHAFWAAVILARGDLALAVFLAASEEYFQRAPLFD